MAFFQAAMLDNNTRSNLKMQAHISLDCYYEKQSQFIIPPLPNLKDVEVWFITPKPIFNTLYTIPDNSWPK